MYWPRLRLTPLEAKYSAPYGDDPNKTQRGVLRRLYYGTLNFNNTIRQDTETFQISRRSRVFGLTASGDINQVEIQIIDVTGEQFTTDFIPLSNLIGGTNFDPRAFLVNNFGAAPGFQTGFVIGANTYIPHIFEPNIVLAPNQTLNFNGRPINPDVIEEGTQLHVSFCVHVWEFPGMPGSPI